VTPKHVASRTLTEASWSNTTVLRGDAVAAVATLRQSDSATTTGVVIATYASGDV
jgi:hypothetical protein